MSFKERVIEICNSDIACYKCPLRVPCDRASNTSGQLFWKNEALFWKDEDFNSIKQHLKEYHAKLSEELTLIEEMLKED